MRVISNEVRDPSLIPFSKEVAKSTKFRGQNYSVLRIALLSKNTSVPTLLEQIQLISRQGPNVIGDGVVK